MARLNTQLEAKGAEYLTLGELLIRGIEAYPCYTNQAHYDLIATKGNQSCRIQVKSRFYTGSNSFPIQKFECDFVVFVSLNRGYERIKLNGELGIGEPEFYVLPVAILDSAQDNRLQWNKVHLHKIGNLLTYQKAWHLISRFLQTSECHDFAKI